MDNMMDKVNQILNSVVDEIGTEALSQILMSLKQKSHEAKNFAKCDTIQEAEEHMIGCNECLLNMPPIEVYWKMTHVMPDTQCATPMHSKDRHLAN